MAVAVRFEVWSRPESGTFERRFQLKGVSDHNLQLGIFGHGSITLSASHPRIDDILTVDSTTANNNRGTMIRAYIGTEHFFDFYASRMSLDLGSSGTETVRITGPGPGKPLGSTIVFPQDYTHNPSKTPNWAYGPSNSVLSNEGFETEIVWEDFEDESPGGWSQLSGSDLYGTDYIDLVSDPAISQTEAADGVFSLRTQFGESPSGISRTLRVLPYSTITIDYYFKEPANLGTRYVMFAEATNTYGTNSWIYNGYAFTELDNAPRYTGASDGTWQTFSFEIKVGNVSSIVIGLSIVSSTAEPVGYLDYGTFGGDGLGLEPWQSYRANYISFVLNNPVNPSTSPYVRSGNQSALFQSNTTIKNNGGYTGIRQFVFCEPLARYNLVGWVYHESGSNEYFRVGLKRIHSSWTAGLTDITVPTHTWTRLQTNGVAIQEAYEYTIRWMNRTGGTTGSPQFWVDDCSMGVGEDISTFGYIMNQLLDDAGSNHSGRTALSWLNRTFTDTKDSNGNDWPVEIATSISRGQTLGQVIGNLSSSYGYDANIRPSAADESVLELNLYIATAMGTDYTATDKNAVTGSGITSLGPLIRTEPPATKLMLEGNDQFWGEGSLSALIPEWGELEAWSGSSDYTQGTLVSNATNLLAQSTSETVALSFQNPNLVPGVDYKLGDYVLLKLGEDILPSAKYRVVDIVVISGDPESVFQVQFASE